MRSTARPAGFTLIEMLVVLVVLGLTLGLVVQRGPTRSATLETRGATGQLLQSLRQARSRAIALNRDVAFKLEVAQHRYQVEGEPPHALPVTMEISGPPAINFRPEGGSTGARIDLSNGQRHMRISVDWLTGRASAVDVN